MSALSVEVITTILSFLTEEASQATIVRYAFVSKAWRTATRHVVFADIELSSTSSTRHLQRSLASAPELRTYTRSLTFVRGSRRRPASTRKGKGKGDATIEDGVTPEDVVLLATQLALEAISLRELGFSTFRRRQVNFVLSLPAPLRSLSLCGRLDETHGGFNLHTIGQLLTNLPHLTTLALRNIQVVPASLEGLVPPTYALQSLALFNFGGPALEPAHLRWLLRSTSHAESLRHLALEWHADSARTLNPVRYLALRVTHLALSSSHPGVPESLAIHFPSLKVLELKSTARINVERLLANLEGPLDVLADRSVGMAAGIEPGSLAQVLRKGYIESVDELKRVRVGRTSEELVMACVGVGAKLEVRPGNGLEAEEPFIPRR
ncbi:hypothetical protein RQP46_003258 [Phenoliferia psychrophenolica]